MKSLNKKLVITDTVIIMNKTVSTLLKSLLCFPTVLAEYKNFPVSELCSKLRSVQLVNNHFRTV